MTSGEPYSKQPRATASAISDHMTRSSCKTKMEAKFQSMGCVSSSMLNIATKRRSVAARPAVAAKDQSSMTPRMSTACPTRNRLRLPRKMWRSALSRGCGCQVWTRNSSARVSLRLSKKSAIDAMPKPSAENPKHHRHDNSAGSSTFSCHTAAKPSRKGECALRSCGMVQA